MKKVFSTLGMMLIAAAMMAQNLHFSNTEYRFPTLRENDKESTHVFTFVNKSSDQVEITGVVCLQKNIRITWGKDTIGKKENGGITVIISPKGSLGSFDCPIKISTLEKGKAKEYTLKVTGEVLEREKNKQEIYGMKEGNLRYKTNFNTGYKLAPTIVLVDTFFFYNEWNETMTFSTGNIPAVMEISYLTPKLAPLEEGIVVFRYKTELKKDWGNIYDKFTIHTNDPDRPDKTFSVAGEIYDDFASWTSEQLKNAPKVRMSEEKYNFGTVSEGENVEHTFTITNIGKSKLYIRKTNTTCGCTVGRPEKNELDPGESTSIKATFRTQGKPGSQSRPIDIITNDPERPKVTITLEGNVRKTQ
jgi:hypothetical protein